MNIKEAESLLTKMLHSLSSKDHMKFSNDVIKLKFFIESQQKTIKDMKCCGNCKHESIWYGDNDCEFRDTCDNEYSEWELEE